MTQKMDLVIAIPKGAQQESCIQVLNHAGMPVSFDKRQLWCNLPRQDLSIVLLKAKDIPTMIASRRIHAGLVGNDLVAEQRISGELDVDLLLIEAFGFSQRIGRRVAWTLAFPQMAQVASLADLRRRFPDGPVLATEIPHVTAQWLASKRLEGVPLPTRGSTEAFAPRFADGIVDLVDSGESLKSAGLVAVAEVLRSEVCLWMSTDEHDGVTCRRIQDLGASLKLAIDDIAVGDTARLGG